jgi:integrase/recombinase XerD
MSSQYLAMRKQWEAPMAAGTENLPLFSGLSEDKTAATETSGKMRADSSLSAAINAWGQYLEESGKSIHTVKAFTADLRLLAKFVSGGQAINAIGTHDLKNFLDWMLNRRGVPCSPKTYARRITSLKSFFRWLTESGILDQDPAAAVPQQSVISPLPEVLSPQEIEAVLEAAKILRREEPPDARSFVLLSLLLDTGIKKSECLRIHLNHIDLMALDGPILFIRYGDVRKRYRERKLPLNEEWIEAYQEYLAQYEPEKVLFPYSPRRLEYLLEDLGDDANLDKHLSFNMCRWTAALTDYRAGKEANKIRQKLGISKIQWREVGKKLERLSAQMDAGKI